MDAIEDMGVEVINSYETAQDVTEEYVDLEGRIEALQASHDRLLELMANAEFTEDLLRAEQELTIREAELEALFGRSELSFPVCQPVTDLYRPAALRALRAD